MAQRSIRSRRKLIRHLVVLSAVRAMGGQAVLNGVMMRGADSYAVACRRMDNSIDIKRFDVPSFAMKFVKIPLLRGVMGLGESMALGYRALMHSADLMIIDEEAKAKADELEKAAAQEVLQVDDSTKRAFAASEETEGSERSEGRETAIFEEASAEVESGEEEKGLSKWAVGTSVAFSLTFFVALFIVSPLLASKWIENALDLTNWQGFFIESSLRLVIFLGYLSAVALIPDIKRVFQYHGAEHKAIAAYENDVVLTPKSAQQFTTAHVRCGTNFLLIVMVMSIVFYAGISAFFPDLPVWGLLLSRVIVIPLIAAVSYEIIRAAAPRMSHLWVRIMVRPGLLLQKVTTRPPSDEQCEVAIASLEEVFSDDQKEEVASRSRVQAEKSWQTLEDVRLSLA
jgi:uncharacterized protein YqhQ